MADDSKDSSSETPTSKSGRINEESNKRAPTSDRKLRGGWGGGRKKAKIDTKIAKNRGVLVVSAFEDYAFDYGLRVGDRITMINGESVFNKDVDEVRNMLRGEPETQVTLRFERDAKRPMTTESSATEIGAPAPANYPYGSSANPEDPKIPGLRELKPTGNTVPLSILPEASLAPSLSPATPALLRRSESKLNEPKLLYSDSASRTFEVTLQRTLVRIKDIKLATLLDPVTGAPLAGQQQTQQIRTFGNAPSGNNKDQQSLPSVINAPIGYIQLSGFSQDAGVEVYRAYTSLERQSIAICGQRLSGLVLDLRGNPGGLLSSAVDVASLLVPKGSNLVSAQGRGFSGVLYRSNGDPIRDPAKNTTCNTRKWWYCLCGGNRVWCSTGLGCRRNCWCRPYLRKGSCAKYRELVVQYSTQIHRR